MRGKNRHPDATGSVQSAEPNGPDDEHRAATPALTVAISRDHHLLLGRTPRRP